MATIHGQHDNRAARDQATANWLNARPMTPSGDLRALDQDPDYTAIFAHSEAIKLALDAGCKSVAVCEQHAPTRQALKAALCITLPGADFAKIVFDPE